MSDELSEQIQAHYKAGNLHHLSLHTRPDGTVEASFRDMNSGPVMTLTGRDPTGLLTTLLRRSSKGRKAVNEIKSAVKKPKLEEDFL